jgi:serine O-acetyltransferase
LRFFIERFIEITTGISLPAEATIVPGLRIHHFGGIIMHSKAVVGEGCTLGVTLAIWEGGAPHIGHHVLIGAGAKLLGQTDIGDYCCIGANAVVLTAVPPRCLAVGVPVVIKASTTQDRDGILDEPR